MRRSLRIPLEGLRRLQDMASAGCGLFLELWSGSGELTCAMIANGAETLGGVDGVDAVLTEVLFEADDVGASRLPLRG